MADSTALSLYLNMHFHNKSFKSNYVYFRILERNDLYVRHKNFHLLTDKSFKCSALKVSHFKRTSPGESLWRYNCVRTLINVENAAVPDWVPIVDQVLLMASMFLTYVAGVTPVTKINKSPINVSVDYVVPKNTTSSGCIKSNDSVGFSDAWGTVRRKLIDSMTTVELQDSLGNMLNEFDKNLLKRPLSLFAIARGPRLRLLWSSFQQIEKEVINIVGSLNTISMLKWLPVSYEIIQRSCQSVSVEWLEKELGIRNSKTDNEVFQLFFEELKADKTIVQNIRKSGKEDLYAELLYFLRFGSLWKDCCYDKSLFFLNGVAILEDLLITLADGIVSIYLELISVDGNMSNEMNNQGLILCTLSTRELQRLRNEVVLNRWLHQNIEAVVSMYEDRFDLCTFQIQSINKPISTHHFTSPPWWEQLSFKKAQPLLPPLSYAVITLFCLPVKRTRELRALNGWRYYFSLFLELSDIVMPLIRVFFSKVSDAITFLLVTLIGRSLGLIFSGIRQSLRWK